MKCSDAIKFIRTFLTDHFKLNVETVLGQTFALNGVIYNLVNIVWLKIACANKITVHWSYLYNEKKPVFQMVFKIHCRNFWKHSIHCRNFSTNTESMRNPFKIVHSLFSQKNNNINTLIKMSVHCHNGI